MGKLVSMIGVSHSPFMSRMLDPKDVDPLSVKVRELFEEQRIEIERSRPNLLLCLGNDHFNQLFMDNMPAFLIGKAPVAKGTWPSERVWGGPDYEAPVDTDFAREIVARGFDHDVDFAYSDECIIDHSLTIPLCFLRPQRDLPIVPLISNVMAPPLPTARRCYKVGEALRNIIEDYPSDIRVGVIASGHLGIEIGGPRVVPDPGFDHWAVELVGRGKVQEALDSLTFERFMKAGNYTGGFLNYVMLMGLARGEPADHYSCFDMIKNLSRLPFIRWDFRAAGA